MKTAGEKAAKRTAKTADKNMILFGPSFIALSPIKLVPGRRFGVAGGKVIDPVRRLGRLDFGKLEIPDQGRSDRRLADRPGAHGHGRTKSGIGRQ